MEPRTVFPVGQGGGGTAEPFNTLPSNTDGQNATQTGLQGEVARLYAYNGTTFDRLRTNATTVLTGATQPYALLIAAPGEWSVNHLPAANTKATITKAAGAGGSHICRSITVMLNGLAAAVEATVQILLRDGASGVGTILWGATLHVIPGGSTGIALSNLNIVGTPAAAMTLEFAAAGGLSTTESVSLSGYTSA